MEYSHSDDELVKQPIGYWSWAAYKAVVSHIRAGLAEYGVSQPQWWVLNQVADGDDGRTRQEVAAVLHGYLGVGDTIESEMDTLADRGLISIDDTGRMRLTAEGRSVYQQCAERQTAMRKQTHDGITDEDYLTTLKVLQRMIHNVGGEAWHH